MRLQTVHLVIRTHYQGIDGTWTKVEEAFSTSELAKMCLTHLEDTYDDSKDHQYDCTHFEIEEVPISYSYGTEDKND